MQRQVLPMILAGSRLLAQAEDLFLSQDAHTADIYHMDSSSRTTLRLLQASDDDDMDSDDEGVSKL